MRPVRGPVRTIVQAIAIASLVVAGAACGISDQSEPDAIDRRDVPFELLASTTSPPPTTVATAEAAFPIVLVAGERLVELTRAVPVPAGARQVLRSLLAGPTSAEAAVGVSTAIPSGTRIVSASRRGGSLRIDLAGLVLSGGDQTNAVGQIVLTATAIDGIARVRFRVDGEPVQVPTGDGTLVPGPVTRTDYEALLA